MILTSSPQSVADSRRFSPGEHIPKLAECDRVFSYSECGYFCVAGYRGDTRTVHTHMDRFEEFSSALSSHGYWFTGDSVERMSEDAIRKAREASRDKYGYGKGRW